MPFSRILLCRPFGGINDTLEQINKCLKYATRFQRMLYVDTSISSGLLVNFSDVFKFNELLRNPNVRSAVQQEDYALFNTLSVQPKEAYGRVHASGAWLDGLGRCINDTNVPFTFDFSMDYSENLLVHAREGGGQQSHAELLQYLSFSDHVRDNIMNEKLKLPTHYVSIHVRNTDYQTDYHSFFKTIKDDVIGKNIFIASDDEEVIQYSKDFFVTSAIYSLNKIKRRGNKPLHDRSVPYSQVEKLSVATEALTDLFLLAEAEKFYFTQTMGGSVSGFSNLANYMCAHKRLLHSLLSSRSMGESQVTGV